MPSAREIRVRMNSIQQTRKITNAMYLISSAKLRKAKQEWDQTRPYFQALKAEVKRIFRTSGHVESRYLYPDEGEMPLTGTYGCLVITADKGLAGGYNSNVMNLAVEHMKGFEESNIFCIGQMARDFLEQRGMQIDIEFTHVIQDPTLYHARQIAETIVELYDQNLLDEVFVVYTRRVTAMEQRPEVVRLLPVREEDFDDVPGLVKETDHDQILYEPSVTELMDQLIPQYLIGMIYSALVQSFASEQCARMNAMDSATRNANEMLDKLSHELNRARQSAITNELAEIIAGADALKG